MFFATSLIHSWLSSLCFSPHVCMSDSSLPSSIEQINIYINNQLLIVHLNFLLNLKLILIYLKGHQSMLYIWSCTGPMSVLLHISIHRDLFCNFLHYNSTLRFITKVLVISKGKIKKIMWDTYNARLIGVYIVTKPVPMRDRSLIP